MKTKETIPGEFKKFVVEREFDLNGEVIKVGETLEVTSEQARKLLAQRLGRMIGGSFEIEPHFDGAHAITLWNKAYTETDDYVLCEFLEDCHGFSVKKGERRRLRRSDALEMRHSYTDSDDPLPRGVTLAIPPMPALIKILEPRPRRAAISEEEMQRRASLVMAGVKREDSWMASTFKDKHAESPS